MSRDFDKYEQTVKDAEGWLAQHRGRENGYYIRKKLEDVRRLLEALESNLSNAPAPK